MKINIQEPLCAVLDTYNRKERYDEQTQKKETFVAGLLRKSGQIADRSVKPTPDLN